MADNQATQALDRRLGLISKYLVVRRNDPDGKHDGCRYFVLDPQHDPLAVKALDRYALAARAEGYDALADDIAMWLDSIADSQDNQGATQ